MPLVTRIWGRGTKEPENQQNLSDIRGLSPMHFKIYRFELKYTYFPTKYGFLLESPEGQWGEVAPLEGRNRETLEDVLEQLHALQRGWKGTLFPSVAFGIYGLHAPLITSAPCALLLNGTPDQVLSKASEPHGCTTAKLKIGQWEMGQALKVIQILVNHFHLRIDFNSVWHKADIDRLCANLLPTHIAFLEDPGCSVKHLLAAHDAAPPSSFPSIQVWKPMVRGLPRIRQQIVLSSALESSIGLRSVASLLVSHAIPQHVLGLGTVMNIEEDLVHNKAWIKEGKIHFPSSWELNWNKLVLC